MKVKWPNSPDEAEKLYVLLANRIASEFKIVIGSECNPAEITSMYIKGEDWRRRSEQCGEILWTRIEKIGITNFDDVEAIRARFILCLLPREDAKDQQTRFEWLQEFSRRLGLSPDKLRENVEETLVLFDRVRES